MAIQMTTGSIRNGLFQFPQPSLATVTITNGIASVDEADVRLALQQGWQVMAGEYWPQRELVRMMPPREDFLQWNKTVALGSVILNLDGYVAKVFRKLVQTAKAAGWSEVSPIVFSALGYTSSDPNAISSPSIGLQGPQTFPGGPGLFILDATPASFNGATVTLQYSRDGGQTWTAVPAAALSARGFVLISISGPCLLQIVASGGTPSWSSVSVNFISGNF